MGFIEKTKNLFKDKEKILYSLGFLFFSIYCISNIMFNKKLEIVLYIVFIFMVLGGAFFINYYIPKLEEKPVYNIIKFAIFNVIISPFSFFISRYMVSSGLKLPPSDFDLTLFTIAPFVHGYVIIALLALLSLIHILYLWLKDFLYSLSKNYLNPIAQIFISIIKNDDVRPITKNNTNTEKHDKKIIFRPFAILFVCLFILDLSENKLPKNQIIRFLAYYLDYYEVPLYPNLKANQKVHLHANGIVSYAFIDGFEVTISIEDYNKN